MPEPSIFASSIFGAGALPKSKPAPIPKAKPDFELIDARKIAEKRFPFIARFPQVSIARSRVENKGGLGEFVEPDNPNNPAPGGFTITIGEKSKGLQGGISDTIVADMVHAASEFSPEFRQLKMQLAQNLSSQEIGLAQRRFQQDFKGKFTGSNFENFDNFLFNFWLDGVVQHLLLPENSEIDQILKNNPAAVRTLEQIKMLFERE